VGYEGGQGLGGQRQISAGPSFSQAFPASNQEYIRVSISESIVQGFQMRRQIHTHTHIHSLEETNAFEDKLAEAVHRYLLRLPRLTHNLLPVPYRTVMHHRELDDGGCITVWYDNRFLPQPGITPESGGDGTTHHGQQTPCHSGYLLPPTMPVEGTQNPEGPQPPSMQSVVLPVTIWQAIQELGCSHHQTQRRLLGSGYQTPQQGPTVTMPYCTIHSQ